MNPRAADNYLANDVLTTTPQKLQLLLINAIIQALERARIHWLNNDHKEAGKHLGRAREIVCELFNGFDYQAKSELVGKVAGVYLFIYQTLARAELDKDLNKLDEALRILNIERETWRKFAKITPHPQATTRRLKPDGRRSRPIYLPTAKSRRISPILPFHWKLDRLYILCAEDRNMCA